MPLPADLLTKASGFHWPDLQACCERYGGFWKIPWAEFEAAYAQAHQLMISGSKYEKVKH